MRDHLKLATPTPTVCKLGIEEGGKVGKWGMFRAHLNLITNLNPALLSEIRSYEHDEPDVNHSRHFEALL